MPVMAVNNEYQPESTGDYRSRPRWSAGKKMEAVLRLLRGEPLETLSRGLGVEAHRLAAWRDDFPEGGKEALKGQRPDRSPDDRALRRAERKIGQLTMENEILRVAAEKRGCRSRRRSGPGSHRPPAAGGDGVPRAGRAALDGVRPAWPVWDAAPPGTGAHDRRRRPAGADPPGLARLAVRRRGLPQGPRSAASGARRPGGRQAGATAAAPGGLAGQLGPDVARGVQLRHDWGPQYRSGHFLGSVAWLGIADDAAFLGEPETNGCAERW
jgi:transposase